MKLELTQREMLILGGALLSGISRTVKLDRRVPTEDLQLMNRLMDLGTQSSEDFKHLEVIQRRAEEATWEVG